MALLASRLMALAVCLQTTLGFTGWGGMTSTILRKRGAGGASGCGARRRPFLHSGERAAKFLPPGLFRFSSSKDGDKSGKQGTASSGFEQASLVGRETSTGACTDEDLFPGWSANKDPDTGFTYYFNGATGESKWENPTRSFLNKDRDVAQGLSPRPPPRPPKSDPTILSARLRSQKQKFFEGLSGEALATAIQKEFSRFDTDGSGLLNRDKFATAIQALLGLKLTDAQVDVLFAEYDTDGSGQIDFDEFTSMVSISLLERNMDVDESLALESLSSVLTTDDGLRLSGAEMREARSNWVRDIMSTGRSRVLTKISSRLGVTLFVAVTVAVVSHWSPEGSWWLEIFQVPGWPHELVGGFLAILLVFRTDQAYERFWEGRTQWSIVASEMRSLARVTVAKREMSSKENVDEVLAHLCAWPVALKLHLRGDRNVRELEEIYAAFDIGPELDSVRRIFRADNMPLVIMSALAEKYNKMVQSNTGPEFLSQHLLERSEDSLSVVSKVLSDCEKIKCTPLPLSYSRHSSRFFTLFSLTLPFSLVKDTTPLLIGPIVVGIAWILFATDEIGRVIEEPFGSGLAQEDNIPVLNLWTERTELSTFNKEVMFKRLDKDESGTLDSKEVMRALKISGITVTQQEVEEIVKKYDENSDKVISKEEWLKSSALDEFRRIAIDRQKQSSNEDDFMNTGINLASEMGNVLVMSISGFYSVVGMAFGIGMDDYGEGVKQLEVLPLARYCRSIQRDILEQILFVSSGDERERYITITRKLSKAQTGQKVEIIS